MTWREMLFSGVGIGMGRLMREAMIPADLQVGAFAAITRRLIGLTFPALARCASRYHFLPLTTINNAIGFRCVSRSLLCFDIFIGLKS